MARVRIEYRVESGYSRGEINMSYFSSFVTLGVSVVIIFKSMFIISHLANTVMRPLCTVSLRGAGDKEEFLKNFCQTFSLSLSAFLFVRHNIAVRYKGQQSHSQEFCKCYLKAFFPLIHTALFIRRTAQHIGAPSARNFKCRFSLLFARLKYGSARERTELMFYLQPSRAFISEKLFSLFLCRCLLCSL